MRVHAMVASIAISISSAVQASEPISLSDFIAINRPAPSVVLSYGAADSQAVDVFVPPGDGPHPVAILIHGGCWRDLPAAGREQLRHVGAELVKQGIAVWSVGYRRADESGGGYPSTFQDVAKAIDKLQAEAGRYHFDLSRTVLVGHSAGGHLALWASVRDHIPAGSPLHTARPFLPGAVVSLAGIGDLKGFAVLVPVLCGPGIIERLVPQNAAVSPYAEVSPAELPPSRGRVVMISGILDRLVPPYVADDYARRMQKKYAKEIELIDIPGAGHFDLVTPGSKAWDEVQLRVLEALRMSPEPSRAES